MVNYDEKELSLNFVVISPIVCSMKELKQIYMDGTFKTRFWMNQHYNLLVIATNLPDSLITIPIAFKIGFKGTTLDFLSIWKYLKIIFSKLNINYENSIGISDLGKAELGAFKNFEILNSFYCWWHTFEKCFIPKIDLNLVNKSIKEIIIKRIRMIYSSKTLEIRTLNVLELKKLLKSEVNLYDYFQNYLTE